jgi:hypothetical protein
MVVKKTISNITRGADLLKPKPDLQYIIAAVIGVTVIMMAYKGGQMLFDRMAMMGQSYNPYAPKPDYKDALGIV